MAVVDNFRLHLVVLLPMRHLLLCPLLLVTIIKTIIETSYRTRLYPMTLLELVSHPPLLLVIQLSAPVLLFMSTSPTAVKPLPYRPILLMQEATSINSHLTYSACTERIILSLSSVVSCPSETTLSLTNLM
jgi:hypothetical protein